MFEPEIFWKKFTVLKKVPVTLLGLFGAPPAVIPRPGNCAPHRYPPAWPFSTYAKFIHFGEVPRLDFLLPPIKRNNHVSSNHGYFNDI